MMDNDAKKKYLNQYLAAKRKAALILEQIEELRSSRTSPVGLSDGMPKGNMKSDLSGYMAKLDELLRELDAEKEVELLVYRKISMSIKKIGIEHLEEILTRRYLLGQSWEKIAAEMNYSHRHTLRMHGLALAKFEV